MFKVVCMSDTHCAHREIAVPDGDLLIHAGDALCDGTAREADDFLDWFGALPHPHKIFVPGNHDEIFFWEPALAATLTPPGIAVLVGSGAAVGGILEVWGAPWVPGVAALWGGGHAMAFSLPDAARAARWEALPSVLDILVCHAPPLAVAGGDGDGLVDRAILRASPRLVVCGHIHRARGVYAVENGRGEKTVVVNAACSGPAPEFAALVPIVIDL